MAQMFLQRRSRLRVVCWIESFSESLPQASASRSRTSQSVSTDATLSVCCSMSRCRSCRSDSTGELQPTSSASAAADRVFTPSDVTAAAAADERRTESSHRQTFYSNMMTQSITLIHHFSVGTAPSRRPDSTFFGSRLFKVTTLWVAMVTGESLKSPSTRESFQASLIH